MCVCGGCHEEMELLERDMRKLLPWVLTPLLLGAAPSRQATYTAGQVISPTDVTANEDVIFAWAQGNVDTDSLKTSAVTTAVIADGTILNIDISSSAAIAYSKLNLASSIATGDIADNAVTGTKIAIGSDAQGDLLYYNGTDWTRLGAGTSGQFLKTNGAAANPAWASTSLYEVVTISRFASAGSGTQAVVCGFQPTGVIIIGDDSGAGKYSIGLGDDDADESTIYSTDGTAQLTSTINIIQLDNGLGASMVAVLTSLDANGFTLTWTKSGSPDDTTNFALCMS